MLNNITLFGRLTRDPELRYTQSQKPVASFTVAVDRDFTPKDGGDKQTDFISCVAWSGTAEFVSKHFGKGQLILVNGRLQVREYTDKDGQNRKAYEVVRTIAGAGVSLLLSPFCGSEDVFQEGL